MYAAPMRALVFNAILLAGCGGSQSAPPASPAPTTPPPAGSATAAAAGSDASPATPPPAVVDGMLTKMSEFKDKICGCPDQACVEGVEDEMKAWGNDLAKQGIK